MLPSWFPLVPRCFKAVLLIKVPTCGYPCPACRDNAHDIFRLSCTLVIADGALDLGYPDPVAPYPQQVLGGVGEHARGVPHGLAI